MLKKNKIHFSFINDILLIESIVLDYLKILRSPQFPIEMWILIIINK